MQDDNSILNVFVREERGLRFHNDIQGWRSAKTSVQLDNVYNYLHHIILID